MYETVETICCTDCRMVNVPLRFLPSGEAICKRCSADEWYDVDEQGEPLLVVGDAA